MYGEALACDGSMDVAGEQVSSFALVSATSHETAEALRCKRGLMRVNCEIWWWFVRVCARARVWLLAMIGLCMVSMSDLMALARWSLRTTTWCVWRKVFVCHKLYFVCVRTHGTNARVFVCLCARTRVYKRVHITRVCACP